MQQEKFLHWQKLFVTNQCVKEKPKRGKTFVKIK